MKQRIITGLVGGIGFLFVVYLGKIPYAILIELLAVFGYYEFLKMNNTKLYAAESILGLLTVISIILNKALAIVLQVDDFTFTILLTSVIFYLILIVLKKNRITFDQIGYFIVGIIYIAFGFSYMLETRFLEHGLAFTLLILAATWASDSGAYFTGKYFGKNKLWPEISPNKTIEGSIGGVIFAIIIALIMNYFFNYFDDQLYLIGLGLLISIVGQIGDLVESALKRTKQVKDSGTLLPGHGGVLDRFDSLLFVFPILYLLPIL